MTEEAKKFSIKNISPNVMWFVFLVILNIVDFLTTSHLISTYDTFEVEANPILRYLMNLTGTVYAILLFKMVFLGFFAFVIERIRPIIWAFLCGAYTMIAINNIIMVVETFSSLT